MTIPSNRVVGAVLAVVLLVMGGAGCGGPEGDPAWDSAAADLQLPALRPLRSTLQETYITFVEPDRDRRDALGRALSIDRVAGDRVWAYAWPPGLETLRAKGVAFERLPHPGWNPKVRMGLLGRGGVVRWDHYPTYSEYVSYLQQLAASHPNLCRLTAIGPSTNQVRPHTLWALKISDNPDAAEDEPEVFLTSTMHGDETTGWINLLRLADELLTRHGSDSEITALVDGLEIWLNPLANPDGTYFGSDSSVGSAIRSYVDPDGSEAWVDPNRNFPDPGYGDHPDGEVWWPETQAMMTIAGERHFALAANFHGGAEVVNYPWDYKAALHPDDAWYIRLSRDYADLCQADGPAGYMTDLDDGITNGYAWYQVTGGRQDYMNYFHGCREVTIEVSGTKLPSASSLDSYWASNRRALLGYLGAALKGVRGIVTGPSGEPLAASVTVLGHDVAGEHSAITADPAVGNYHRFLTEGTYNLRFAAEGYISQDVTGVVIGTGPATRVDVVLPMAARVDLRGGVLDEEGLPVPGALVEFLDSSQPVLVTSRSGTFLVRELPENTYSLRISRPGFETLRESRLITGASPDQDFLLYRVLTPFETDLESSNAGFTATGSPATGWQWGVASGGIGAHSGTRVWGTVLGGDYADSASWQLTSGAIALLPINPRLVFWHRYETESNWDGGQVLVSNNGGGSYQLLQPVDPYPVSDVDALDGPGYSGSSGGWVPAEFDLSAYAGQTVRLRWVFASDGSQTDLGWYLDDVVVTGRKPKG